jgi:hypothetical protein
VDHVRGVSVARVQQALQAAARARAAGEPHFSWELVQTLFTNAL